MRQFFKTSSELFDVSGKPRSKSHLRPKLNITKVLKYETLSKEGADDTNLPALPMHSFIHRDPVSNYLSNGHGRTLQLSPKMNSVAKFVRTTKAQGGTKNFDFNQIQRREKQKHFLTQMQSKVASLVNRKTMNLTDMR